MKTEKRISNCIELLSRDESLMFGLLDVRNNESYDFAKEKT